MKRVIKNAGFFVLLLPILFLSSGGGSEKGVVSFNKDPLLEKPNSSDKRPNIIYILSDDQDRESLGAMPRLNRLFQTKFPNHIITTPVCCPSRETSLTGQYAHNHKVYGNQEDLKYKGKSLGGWAAAGSRTDNLGLWLQKSGYYTALVGKYLNGFDDEKPIPRGWNYFIGALEDEDKGYFNYRLNENGSIKEYGEKDDEYSITVFTEKIKEALLNAEEQRKPAFIFFAPPTPHTGTLSEREPLLNPEPDPIDRSSKIKIPSIESALSYNEKDIKDKPIYVQRKSPLTSEEIAEMSLLQKSRWLSLVSLDRKIEEIVRFAEKGWRDNAFLYTTDNGFLLGQHRLRGKFVPYEESINFPLLLRSGSFPDRTYQQLVGNIDIAPTILDIAEANHRGNGQIDGKSVLPILEEENKPWREYILIEGFPMKEGAGEKSYYQPYLGVRGINDVFIWYQKQGTFPLKPTDETEYYNLKKDPGQLKSIKLSPNKESKLKNTVKELSQCSGRDCFLK